MRDACWLKKMDMKSLLSLSGLGGIRSTFRASATKRTLSRTTALDVMIQEIYGRISSYGHKRLHARY
jgi:hypothetical protein